MPAIALQNRIDVLEAKVADLEQLTDELLQLMNGPDGNIDVRDVLYPMTLRKLGMDPPARKLEPGESRKDVPIAEPGSQSHGVPVGGGQQQ